MMNELQYCINSTVEFNQVEDKVVVLDAGFAKAYILDSVAADVLRAFSEHSTVDNALKKVKSIYQDVVEKEFLEFFDQLMDAELLVPYDEKT